jgi:hypothetical protein
MSCRKMRLCGSILGGYIENPISSPSQGFLRILNGTRFFAENRSVFYKDGSIRCIYGSDHTMAMLGRSEWH